MSTLLAIWFSITSLIAEIPGGLSRVSHNPLAYRLSGPSSDVAATRPTLIQEAEVGREVPSHEPEVANGPAWEDTESSSVSGSTEVLAALVLFRAHVDKRLDVVRHWSSKPLLERLQIDRYRRRGHDVRLVGRLRTGKTGVLTTSDGLAHAPKSGWHLDDNEHCCGTDPHPLTRVGHTVSRNEDP